MLLSAQSQAPRFQAALSEALQDLLVSTLCVRAPPRSHLSGGNSGSDTRVFPAFARAQDAGTRRPVEGQVPVVFARVIAELPFDRGRAGSLLEARRRSGVYPPRFTECREPLQIGTIDTLTPEKVFAARWAVALLGEAMKRLRQEYASPQKTATLAVLKAFLDVDNSIAPSSYEEAAATLQVSVGAVKTMIHRLRKQYALLVREEVERTVSDPDDVDAEIHELCEALVVAQGWIVP